LSDARISGDGEELDSWAVLLSGKVELRHLDGRKELLEVGKSFGVTPSLEKQYHRGTLVSLEPDAQFVCIEQAQYYDILHRGRENMIDVLDQVTGEVCLVKEKRMDGPVAIRGTPKVWARQPIFQTKDGLWKDGFFKRWFSKDGKDGFFKR
jgi:hypothetical protein